VLPRGHPDWPAGRAAFLESLAAKELTLETTTAEDLARMAELVRTYADFPLGAVDAAVIAIAERLGAASIATIDHRHFRAVRPAHCEAFELLPG
jgi:predicted nucleic acid-binding protein